VFRAVNDTSIETGETSDCVGSTVGSGALFVCIIPLVWNFAQTACLRLSQLVVTQLTIFEQAKTTGTITARLWEKKRFARLGIKPMPPSILSSGFWASLSNTWHTLPTKWLTQRIKWSLSLAKSLENNFPRKVRHDLLTPGIGGTFFCHGAIHGN
jgi:hypothetical protein